MVLGTARIPYGLFLRVATVAGRIHLVLRHQHPLFGSDAASRYLAELGRLVPGVTR